jgi:uncharacterized protein YwgA
MKVRSVILLATDAFGGKVDGKTLLQKRLYFMSQFLGEDWGYHAHYYGPYSDVVASELVTLKVQGLVNEASNFYGVAQETGFEMKRYDYNLTQSGQEAVQWLKNQYPEESGKIYKTAKAVLAGGEIDYMDLSIAAKAYFIMKAANAEHLTTEEIAAKARDFSWQVTGEQIREACRFLSELQLVKVA